MFDRYRELERGHLHAENISISSPLPNSEKLVLVKSAMDGKGDPGYALTAGEFRAFFPLLYVSMQEGEGSGIITNRLMK